MWMFKNEAARGIQHFYQVFKPVYYFIIKKIVYPKKNQKSLLDSVQAACLSWHKIIVLMVTKYFVETTKYIRLQQLKY